MLSGASGAGAQMNVVTYHNDIARTGANTNETLLTPSNVNSNTFGKLFSYAVDGYVYAQPLYMSSVTMGAGTPQAGTTHNVVFITTEHDTVYAFDADSNLGPNAQPLWQISFLDTTHGVPPGVTASTVPNGDVLASEIVPEIGITATGVIDPSTDTLYVVGKTKEISGTTVTYVQRLHALDITTGAEKFGGPNALQAGVAGFGSGSSNGILSFDPQWENNRTGLLLLNGIVYIAFGAHGDNGPWHGWILAYDASTLSQTGAWCATPNGIGAGIWAPAGLAADVPDPMNHPFGRIFTATGNGDFDASTPYGNSMDYGSSIIALDLANGAPSIVDDFTQHDQAALSNGDVDLGSGAVLLLPDSVGGGNHILTQIGKTGRIYVLNQDNLGGYNPNNPKDPGEAAYVNGLWGIPAYWNGRVYVWSAFDSLKAFSIGNGALSSTYISKSNETANQYSPSPSISANGTTNGIVWSLRTDNYATNGREILYAHDAVNVSNLLYSSEQNVARDDPGNSVKFIIPTIANGKVYVGSESQVSVFGLFGGAPQAATPIISPASQSFNSSLQVTITDSTLGASIYYTTDGSQPTTASTVYTGAFTITSSTTVNAMADGTGLLQSSVATATYTVASQASGSIDYGSGFNAGSVALVGSAKLNGTALQLTDGANTFEVAAAWSSAPVNVQSFTTDFSFQITPGSAPIADGFTFTIQGNNTSAIGPAGGGLGYGPDSPTGTATGIPKSVAVKFDLYSNVGEGNNSTGLYVNGASPTTPATALGGGVNLHSGDVFQVHMSYDGATLTMTITDTTNTTLTFTTSWTIDIPGTVGGTAAFAGFTGGTGGLTATQDILTWTYSAGSGTLRPTLTSIAVTPANLSAPAGTGVQFHATGTYSDNSTQDLTSSASWTSSNTSVATINSSGLASAVAAGTSTVSAAAGSVSGSTILTVTATTPTVGTINYGSGFSAAGLALNGSAALSGTRLRLTNGGGSEASSAWFTSPVNIQNFTTDFTLQLANPGADGMTFAIQNAGSTALGPAGGGLGYGPDSPSGAPGIPNSVAVKFDLYDNAGESTNSTGLYFDGASPTTPAVALGGGVDLHSGDVFQVHMTYDGTTLAMTITDTANPSQTFSTSWAIDIPGTIGSNTAFVGFTGGTGGLTATQDILSWAY